MGGPVPLDDSTTTGWLSNNSFGADGSVLTKVA
jgi:hypothetical protein